MSTDLVTETPVEQGAGQAAMSDVVASQFTAQIESHGSTPGGSGPSVGQPGSDAPPAGAGQSKSGTSDGHILVPPLPELAGGGNSNGSQPQPEATLGGGATTGGKPPPGRRGEGHPPPRPSRPDVCTPEDPRGDGSAPELPPIPPGMSLSEYLVWLVMRPNPRDGAGGKKGS